MDPNRTQKTHKPLLRTIGCLSLWPITANHNQFFAWTMNCITNWTACIPIVIKTNPLIKKQRLKPKSTQNHRHACKYNTHYHSNRRTETKIQKTSIHNQHQNQNFRENKISQHKPPSLSSNPTDKQNIKIKIKIQIQIQIQIMKKTKNQCHISKTTAQKELPFRFQTPKPPSDPMKPMQLQEKLKLGRATKKKKSKWREMRAGVWYQCRNQYQPTVFYGRSHEIRKDSEREMMQIEEKKRERFI